MLIWSLEFHMIHLFKKAKNVLFKIMDEHPLVLSDPKPFVGLLSLGDSSVKMAVRPYTAPSDYWEVYFDLYEEGKNALDKAGIIIPFPQLVIHSKT